MNLTKSLLIAITMLGVGMPALASGTADDLNSPTELTQALSILDTIIEHGQGDALAHELRGDVYKAQGLPAQASDEYAVAAQMSTGKAAPLLSRSY